MMPPECTYCQKESSDNPDLEFEIIYFKRTAEDEAWYARVEKEGAEGHPPNAFWFCTEHLESAKQQVHLHTEDALAQLDSRKEDNPVSDLYFETPEKAVLQITEMLLDENWEGLLPYYDLSQSKISQEAFISGRFFIRDEAPELTHPAGFWKYKHPFAPGFTFDYSTQNEELLTVNLSIEIDQGNGRTQRGTDSFELRNYSDKGLKIIPPTNSEQE